LRRSVLEEATLLASLAKWTALSALVGVLGGAATAVFLLALEWGLRQAGAMPYPLLLPPVGFVVAVVLVRVLAPQAAGHGTEKIIEAVHLRWGHIPLLVAPVKLLATVLSVATGASVGKEGPAAQIGAALASGVASLFWLRRRDRRTLVICGISAGFASVFGTPIAGSIFGVEVLVMGSLLYEVIYPSFVAGIVAYQTSIHLGTAYFHQTLTHVPAPTERLFLTMIVAGIVFGLVALILIEALRGTDALVTVIPGPRWAVAAGGGTLVALVAWATSPRYLGLGVETLEESLRGAVIPAHAFLVKILTTVLSLGSGASGGIVTPIFFVGATSGSVLGSLLGYDRAVFAAIGMVSLLAAAANAPIAAAIMAIELFGPGLGPLAAVSCVVSFLVVGHRSVYGSQLLGAAKSRSIRVRSDIALDRLDAIDIRRRRRRLWRLAQRSARQLLRRHALDKDEKEPE
jgi:H+/Cl- antiporter ClcA